MPPKLSAEIREYVRKRAKFLCEYCHTDERWQMVQFTIDHVLPLADGGTNDLENLALACFHCNRRKSNKTAVFDPVTGAAVSIFNPREMIWNEHFSWSQDNLKIVPISDCGRVTLELLQLNRDRIQQIRQDDKLVHRHPPTDDSIMT